MKIQNKRWFFGVPLLLSLASTPASAEPLIALTSNADGMQSILSFDSARLTSGFAETTLTGIDAGFVVNGIDFRASNRQVYALATNASSASPAPSDSRLYTINLRTGVATPVGPAIDNALNFSSTTRVGFDFNPQVDAIRAITDLDQNIVINANTGALAARATDVFYAAGDPNEGVNPQIEDIAYDNNVSGATSTQQFGIDVGTDSLVTVANNAGTLRTIGSLDIDGELLDFGGFDISSTGAAFAILTTQAVDMMGNPSSFPSQALFSIDLSSGAATSLGLIPLGFQIDGLTAIQAIPEPTSLALLAIGGVGVGLARRRRARFTPAS